MVSGESPEQATTGRLHETPRRLIPTEHFPYLRLGPPEMPLRLQGLELEEETLP